MWIKNKNKCPLFTLGKWLLQGASGAEHSDIRNKYFKLNITGLKIPTDSRQASWLFTSVAGELDSDLLWNNFSCRYWSERDLNPGTTDFKSGALTTRPHFFNLRLLSLSSAVFRGVTDVVSLRTSPFQGHQAASFGKYPFGGGLSGIFVSKVSPGMRIIFGGIKLQFWVLQKWEMGKVSH